MMQIVSLSDAITLQRGFDLPTSQRRRGKYPVVASTGTTTTHDKFKVKGPGVVIGRSGSIGGGQYVESDFWPLNTTLWVKDFKGNDEKFIYYTLKSLDFSSFNVGAAVPTLNRNHLSALKVRIPDVDKQKKIANILGSLDEKIELNRHMNETLEQLSQTLFRHYFVDNPEATVWKSGTLGDIIVNFDSKRKPLSSRQRAEMQGAYRYFGATSVMDRINDYLFDGTYLLLAEDGSVMRSDGTPYLQYVWGRFWVNNHAHIIQAKYPFTVEYLYLLLAKTNVQSLVSGAVQLKINQKAMNSLVISIPPDDLVIKFCNLVNSLFAQYRENEEQIELLVNLRDSLLPKLISGEIEV